MRIDPNMPTPPQRIPSPPDSNASGERSVGRTWIFDALWSLCTNRSVKLQVPDTILLRNGAPYRWISTNDNGFLSRKSLQIYANHEVDQIPSARGKSSIIDARLILNAIAAFPISSTGNKDDDEPVCCAWYHDHRSENLTMKDLNKLVLMKRWRKQVIGIQDYLLVASHRIGSFNRKQSAQTHLCLDKADVAANAVTRCIAAHGEAAYNDISSNQKNSDRTRRCDIVIKSMVANFVVDRINKLWFSKTTSLVIRYQSPNSLPNPICGPRESTKTTCPEPVHKMSFNYGSSSNVNVPYSLNLNYFQQNKSRPTNDDNFNLDFDANAYESFPRYESQLSAKDVPNQKPAKEGIQSSGNGGSLSRGNYSGDENSSSELRDDKQTCSETCPNDEQKGVLSTSEGGKFSEDGERKESVAKFRREISSHMEMKESGTETPHIHQQDERSLEVRQKESIAAKAWQEAAKNGRQKARQLHTLVEKQKQRNEEQRVQRIRAKMREELRRTRIIAQRDESRHSLEAIQKKISLLMECFKNKSSKNDIENVLDELIENVSHSSNVMTQAKLGQTIAKDATIKCKLEVNAADLWTAERSGTREATGNEAKSFLPFQNVETTCHMIRHRSLLAQVKLEMGSRDLRKADKCVQARFIAWKQKSDSLKKIITWTKKQIAICKCQIVRTRQHREDLGNEIERQRAVIRKHEDGIASIDAELERLGQQVPSKYFDTCLSHHDGVIQRVRSKAFRNSLQGERSSLIDCVDGCRLRLKEIAYEIKKHGHILSQESQSRSLLTSAHSRLCNALLDPIEKSMASHHDTEETSSNDQRKDKGTETCSPASIRWKYHRERSQEEREWACLDFRLHPEMYKDGYQPCTSDDVLVDIKSAERISKLPEQMHLAMAYLESQEEVKLHYLINKFTLGRGEPYFIAIDRSSSNTTDCVGIINHHSTIVGKETTLEAPSIHIRGLIANSTLETGFHEVSRGILRKNSTAANEEQPPSMIYESVAKMIESKDAFRENADTQERGCFVESPGVLTLHTIHTTEISKGEQKVHSFIVRNSEECMLRAMTVSVVFQGVFSSMGYEPGCISVSLARNKPGDRILQPTGFASAQDQAVNTKNALGRIVIEHDPTMVIESGYFEVLVIAETDAKYSFTISGKTCDGAQVVLERELASFLQERQLIKQYDREISSLWLDMELSERKLSLLANLVKGAQSEIDTCKVKMARCDKCLKEFYETDPPETEFDSVHEKIKVLEMEYAHWSQVSAFRVRQQDDTRENIQAMAKARVAALERSSARKLSVEKKRRELPLAAACLFDPLVAAKVTEMCDSHFDIDRILSSDMESLSTKSAAHDIALLCSTPGEKVRRLVRRDGGFEGLTKEEKSWCALDRIINPGKWELLSQTIKDLGVQSIPAAKEVLRIRETPSDHLRQKQDKNIKYLLLKYDDDVNHSNSACDDSNVNCGRLATKTRCKLQHLYTQEDREWQSIDIILNPDEWKWRFGGRKMAHLSAPDRWKCHFCREEIVQIWKVAADRLPCYNERRVHELLHKYNGSFKYYSKAQASTSGRDLATAKGKSIYSRKYQFEFNSVFKVQPTAYEQCHLLLDELNRAIHCHEASFVSSILNGTAQTYPVPILCREIECELNRMLISETLSLERKLFSKVKDKNDCTVTQNLPLAPHRHTTLEENERAKRLGRGGCLACNSNPCRRNSPHNDSTLVRKKYELTTKIGVCCSFSKEQIQRELRLVCNKISLNKVDSELHFACASVKRFIETESLHGYKTCLSKGDAIKALHLEQNRLVAIVAADEVLDEILDWMLNGWYFGERETKLDTKFREVNDKIPARPGGGLLAEISSINAKATHRFQEDQYLAKEQQRQKELDQTENSAKFGLFMITFMYFRSRHLVRREKSKLSGDNDLIGGTKVVPTEERARMAQEDKAAKDRLVRLKHAFDRARIGNGRERQRKREKEEQIKETLQCRFRKRAKEANAAQQIQKIYRGHIARTAALLRSSRLAKLRSADALYNESSMTISRFWRGHRGRQDARAVRRATAEFIVAMRSRDLELDKKAHRRRKLTLF